MKAVALGGSRSWASASPQRSRRRAILQSPAARRRRRWRPASTRRLCGSAGTAPAGRRPWPTISSRPHRPAWRTACPAPLRFHAAAIKRAAIGNKIANGASNGEKTHENEDGTSSRGSAGLGGSLVTSNPRAFIFSRSSTSSWLVRDSTCERKVARTCEISLIGEKTPPVFPSSSSSSSLNLLVHFDSSSL